MKRCHRALTKGEITEALSYLPRKHKNLVKGTFQTYNTRQKNPKGQVVEGKYVPSKNKIVLYAFSIKEILSKRYLNTIWHEVGHKVFHQFLTRGDKESWEKIRRHEKFIIDLADVYGFKELWEEEFCFTYQILVRLNFYKTNKMNRKEKKLEKTLNSIPKRKNFVKKTFSGASSKLSKKSNQKDCLKLAQDRLEKVIGPLV